MIYKGSGSLPAISDNREASGCTPGVPRLGFQSTRNPSGIHPHAPRCRRNSELSPILPALGISPNQGACVAVLVHAERLGAGVAAAHPTTSTHSSLCSILTQFEHATVLVPSLRFMWCSSSESFPHRWQVFSDGVKFMQLVFPVLLSKQANPVFSNVHSVHLVGRIHIFRAVALLSSALLLHRS